MLNYIMLTGSYRAVEWAEDKQSYHENKEMGIVVEVVVRSF
jgi:hypothetical protein